MRRRERDRMIEAHIERGNALMEEIGVQLALSREELKLSREALGLNRRESETSRDVMRALVAEIKAFGEENRRHHEAVVGALTDLAAEIRSWGGGAAPATG